MQDYGGYGMYGGYPPPPEPPRRPSLWRYVAVAVAAGAIGAGSVLAVGHIGSNAPVASLLPSGGSNSVPAVPQPSQPALGGGEGGEPGGGQAGTGQGGIGQGGTGQGGTGLSAAQQAIYNKVSPGLVIIRTSLNYQSMAAAGTGMVLNSDGLVLTNNHVIENATSISATVLATGKTYTAKVLGYDETGDVAAIQLQGASGLHTVPLGNSGAVKSGDSVIAMGNAEGQSQIVPAAGTIIAVNQTITAQDPDVATETLHAMLKTDAAIVSGDSGGALANSAGQVIGMNTAGNNDSNSFQATGFAIPIDTALSIVNRITTDQASSTVRIGYPPFMGIFIATGTSSNPQIQAQQQNEQNGGSSGFGGPPGGSSGSGGSGNGGQSCYTNDDNLPVPTSVAPVKTGTLIIGTICQGPASSAEMSGGDVITAVNGQPVGAPSQLETILAKFKPGDSVSITWESVAGRTTTSSIKLTAGPPK
jgi:S1-C subfamily serine protease